MTNPTPQPLTEKAKETFSDAGLNCIRACLNDGTYEANDLDTARLLATIDTLKSQLQAEKEAGLSADNLIETARAQRDELEQKYKDCLLVVGEVSIERDALKQQVEDSKAEATHLLFGLCLWSSTFQKYQSWKANRVPASKYPDTVEKDYLQCSKLTDHLIESKPKQI